MHPDAELLASLALGEPTDRDILDHVADCAQCRAEVSALGEVVSTMIASPPALTSPPSAVWDRILEQIDQPEMSEGGSPPEPQAPPSAEAPVADLAQQRAKRTPSRARIVLPWAAAAAAAGLLIGGGTVAWVSQDQAPEVSVVKQANLDTLDTKAVRGEADLVRDGSTLTLKLTTEPMDAEDGYLAVWLINKDLKRMVSIGVMPSGATEQTFEVSQSLIDAGYVIVDISDEPYDDNPAHSGKTLARGQLA